MNRSAPDRNWQLPIAACIAAILWAWHRLEFFTISRLVPGPDGTPIREPNALATVDHPFHAARFGAFLDAVRDGGVPRWIPDHQGGYPAEFYPFGSSIVDLIVWLLTLGQMSLPMVHTWSVAIVFALPAVGFAGIARLSGRSMWLAPVALLAHLCVRGWWWSGGSYELIDWGLVTNVLAAVLIFLALVSVGALLDGGRLRWIPVIALLIGWATYTNPRSLIAVGTIAIAALLVWLVDQAGNRIPVRFVVAPFALGLAVAAPVLIPLIRYNDLYFFVHYSGYESVRTWLDSSVQAVSGPVFCASLAGIVIVLLTQSSLIERLIAWTTVVYALVTVYLITVDWP